MHRRRGVRPEQGRESNDRRDAGQDPIQAQIRIQAACVTYFGCEGMMNRLFVIGIKKSAPIGA